MIFKDICFLFPEYQQNLNEIFLFIFPEETFKSLYGNKYQESVRKAITKITIRDTKSNPPERMGTNYKALFDDLGKIDLTEFRQYLDEKVISTIDHEKLTSFILEKINELKLTVTIDSPFFMTLEELEKCVCSQVRYASSVAFLILVLYAIYGAVYFHRYFSWIYQPDDEKAKKLYENIFTNPNTKSAKINFRHNINYFGYSNEMLALEEAMNTYHTVFLYGMGGIGKTEIAKQYAFRHQNEYLRILLFTYETTICDFLISEKFPGEGVARKFDEDGNPESDESYGRRKLNAFLRHSHPSTLIIIDNFDTSYDPMLKELLSSSYSVIVTTRNDWSHLRFPVIELKGLDEKAQTELFHTYYTKQLFEREQKLLPELLHLLYGHPLTIQLTAKLMKRRIISVSKMVEILRKDGITPELKGNIPYEFGNADTLYHHIQKLFRLDSLSEEEKQVMINMSLLPVEGIDAEKFMMLSNQNDSEQIMTLADRNWIFYSGESDFLSMHPLIANVVKQEFCLSMKSADVFLQQFADVTDNTWGMSVSEKCQYSEIALRILQNFPEVNFEYLRLYRNIANILMRTDHFELSSKLFQECLKCTLRNFGEHSKETAEFYYYMADLFVYTGDLSSGEKYIDKVIAIMETLPLELKTAYYVKYKAWIMLNHVNPETLCQANYLLAKTKDILEKLPEKTTSAYLEQKASLDTAYSYYHYYNAEYETALDYSRQAFDIYINLFGEVHPDSIAPLTIKSLIYSKMGYSEQAVSIIQDVITIQKKIFPEHSQKLLLRYRDLAIIYYNIGQLNNAVEIMEYVCEEFRKNSEKSGTHDIIYTDSETLLLNWKKELVYKH